MQKTQKKDDLKQKKNKKNCLETKTKKNKK